MFQEELLAELKASKDYISGQELCEKFGVSRTAVWKAIQKLKNGGYLIQSVQNKGYKLVDDTDVLNETEIRERLHTKWAGQNLVYKDVTASTNIDAKELGEQGAAHGTLVVADKQTAGRGRRGHSWDTMGGTTIAMSLLCRPKVDPGRASMLTLVMGLALAEAIEDVCGQETKIKWPNDTVIHGKKVTGTLTEMSAEMDLIHYVVIGTGINVNTPTEDFAEEIRDMAGSLKTECGHACSRAETIAKTMDYFEKYYEIFEKTEDLSGLKEAYEAKLVNQNAQVRVLDPKGEYEGIARGIDELGNLLVETEGGIQKVYAGEVSVRGLYGYT